MSIFNNINGNDPFGALQVEGVESPGFPSGFLTGSRNSIFNLLEEDSPLGNWGKHTNHDNFVAFYYTEALIDTQDNITIYNNIGENKSEIIKWFVENSNPDYKINVFIEPDGNALLLQYMNKPVADNEIAIFFESDDRFNISGSIYRIRLGKNVIKNLKDYYFLSNTPALAEEILQKYPELKEIGQSRLEKLINRELDKDTWMVKLESYYQTFKLKPLDLLNVFGLLADGIRFLRPENPKYWDATRKDFSPFFPIPMILNAVDPDTEKIAQEFGEIIIKKIDNFFQQTEATRALILKGAGFAIPDWSEDLSEQILEVAKHFYFDEIRPRIKDFIEFNITTGIEYIYLLNAFFTGALSGTLNLIAGLAELIGFISKFALDRDFEAAVREQVENLIEEFFTNTLEVLGQVWDKIKELVRKAILYLDFSSQYDVAYKLGVLIFEIVELVVSFLKIGKIKKLLDALEELKKITNAKTLGKTINKKIDNIDEKIAKKIRVFKFKTTKMKPSYLGEETGKGWCSPNKVKYLNEAERKNYELFVRDGKLFKKDGKLFDTSEASTAFSQGKAIFVMSEDGRIFASVYHDIGKFHHSSFLSGNPIASAGELLVEKGIIKVITRKSGHYRPTKSLNSQFTERLKVDGIDIDTINFNDKL